MRFRLNTRGVELTASDRAQIGQIVREALGAHTQERHEQEGRAVALLRRQSRSEMNPTRTFFPSGSSTTGALDIL